MFSKQFLVRHQFKLVFVIIWLHVSTLDLFYITYSGPVFLWQENAQFITLLVHVIIAALTTCCYWAVEKKIVKKWRVENIRS